jgi:gentisate 1,2-dioxygenase
MSTTSNGTSYTNGTDTSPDSAERLIRELDGTNTLPLWAQMTKLNPPLPNPKCVPHIWRYSDVKPYLIRAGNLITEKQAERRVLMLVNPTRGTESPTLLFSGVNMTDD